MRFQGQHHDPETGLHYNRYRYYGPQVGRLVSRDPIGYAGGLNVFQYAPNPIEWIVPFGLAGHRTATRADQGVELGRHLTDKQAWQAIRSASLMQLPPG
ncbi:RHS repeat-associated core domain-containing protein [Achromobacter spanius]|uniref:RHS repeat-associated core domain-containing protein n=1 Tax=Achromobacter spanius TaxID=217203 RepID=UPI001F0C59B6|nr:RHS repeat-associated core domain-containing protein [Achromobacter spanius]